MIQVRITDGVGIDLVYNLEHDPERAIVIHSPEPGVVHVRHTIVPRPAAAPAPSRARLKAVEP